MPGTTECTNIVTSWFQVSLGTALVRGTYCCCPQPVPFPFAYSDKSCLVVSSLGSLEPRSEWCVYFRSKKSSLEDKQGLIPSLLILQPTPTSLLPDQSSPAVFKRAPVDLPGRGLQELHFQPLHPFIAWMSIERLLFHPFWTDMDCGVLLTTFPDTSKRQLDLVIEVHSAQYHVFIPNPLPHHGRRFHDWGSSVLRRRSGRQLWAAVPVPVYARSWP